MSRQQDIKAMDQKIRQLRATAEELRDMGRGVEAVKRNANRILAIVWPLEGDVSDVSEVM